ncbi:7 transmembrane sweet-taste receptor of 3 GCPR-domain-containing protein [Neocallimastix sp. 'constans']
MKNMHFLSRSTIQYFYIFILIYLIVQLVESKEVYINNEQELIQNINSNKILIINNSFNVSETIEVSSDISSISFQGNNPNISSINILNDAKFIFNNNNSIKFYNITLNGQILFNENKNVFIENVNFNGYINATLNDGNVFIKSSQMTSESTYNNTIDDAFIFRNGNIVIEDSKFYGNRRIKNLINFDGNNKYQIKIIDSFFDGNYESSHINISNGEIKLEGSKLINGYSYENGGSSVIKQSTCMINNCYFENNFSFNSGGSIYFENAISVEANIIEVYNSSCYGYGGFIQVSSDYNNNIVNINDLNIYGYGPKFLLYGNGMIAGLSNYANVHLKNVHGEDLYAGSLIGTSFILFGDSVLIIENIYLNNLYGGVGGMLLYSYNPLVNGITCKITNCTFTNFEQVSEKNSAILNWQEKGVTEFKNCRIENVKGRNSYILYGNTDGIIEFTNVNITNFRSQMAEIAFSITYNVSLKIQHSIINNVIFYGKIFQVLTGHIELNDLTMKNVNLGENKDFSTLFQFNSHGTIDILNSKFYNITGSYAFNHGYNSHLNINNTIFSNCNFTNSMFNIYQGPTGRYGRISILNSTFNDNKGNNGAIFNLRSGDNGIISSLLVQNCTFNNNYSYEYGGVIYSISIIAYKSALFLDCTFSNNTSYNEGDICYSLNQDCEPSFNNKDNIIRDCGISSFATNPSYIGTDDNTSPSLNILSGQLIEEPLIFVIKDVNNNNIDLNFDINKSDISKMLFYQLEMNDTYNSKIYGSVNGFCYDKNCKVSNFRIVGNPGKYILIFKLLTFGRFIDFKNNTLSIDVNINPCNRSTYIEKYIENENILSCFSPFCEPSCNSGICVNDNICNCTNPIFTGKYCNEYYQLEKKKLLNIIFIILSIILIILSVVLIYLIIAYKNNTEIKLAGYDLLIIILLGSIINYFFIINLTYSKTTIACTFNYLLKNLGFSLVFGTLLVKNIRLYSVIYSWVKKFKFKNIYMFYIIFIITSFHLFILLIWVITRSIKTDTKLDENFREYTKCSFPYLDKFCTIFNGVVILLGCFFAYLTKSLEKIYTESLSIPIYLYLLYYILSEFCYYNENISVLFEDIINSIGTFLYTILVIKYVIINKFLIIYERYLDYMKQMKRSEERLQSRY